MERQVNVGIIGVGRIGYLRARLLVQHVPEACVVAVADIRREAAEACAAQFGIPQVFGNYEDLLLNKKIEAVFICTNTANHLPIIRDAAEAGKHIFCEKPIAPSLKATDQALTAVRSAGVLFQVGFNRRFDPSFCQIRELLAAGRLGKPYILRITSRDPDLPPLKYIPTSGGLFLDMTIHDFDMARYLIGDEIEEVFATGSVLVDPRIRELGDIDTAAIVLRFQRGTLGLIDNSRRAVYGYDQRVEVLGSKGMAIALNRKTDTVKISTVEGVRSSRPLFFFTERYIESFIAEMKTFIRCVRENRSPPVTGEDGRVAAALACAAMRSLKEHRPIRLNEII